MMNHLPPAPGPIVRLWIYNPWAGAPMTAKEFLAALPQTDLSRRTGPAASSDLRRMARLDCDWQGENVRCFSTLAHPDCEFRPALVLGAAGLAEFISLLSRRPQNEIWWLVFTGQQPGDLPSGIATKVASAVRQQGGRVLFYAYDEASRTMTGFGALAPQLDVLIHDELPLDPFHAAQLPAEGATLHRSWVANAVPFAVPFHENPSPTILFLGSQLGLTPHRERQIAYLRQRFKDRLIVHTDHSVAVSSRGELHQHQVAFCPEGRKFSTPAMSQTHTDRPFWSGCLGLVSVVENSRAGDRLNDLAAAHLIERYPHADLAALGEACERALAWSTADRRRIYAHFNQHETIGPVVSHAIARHVSTNSVSEAVDLVGAG